MRHPSEQGVRTDTLEREREVGRRRRKDVPLRAGSASVWPHTSHPPQPQLARCSAKWQCRSCRFKLRCVPNGSEEAQIDCVLFGKYLSMSNAELFVFALLCVAEFSSCVSLTEGRLKQKCVFVVFGETSEPKASMHLNPDCSSPQRRVGFYSNTHEQGMEGSDTHRANAFGSLRHAANLERESSKYASGSVLLRRVVLMRSLASGTGVRHALPMEKKVDNQCGGEEQVLIERSLQH